MSIKRMKRAAPLLVMALMVAKVFSPAMSALKLSTAAPGMDASPVVGAVPGIHYSGIAPLIEDDDGVIPFGGGNTFGVRRVSAVPGPDTFTEIFEITAPRSVALEGAQGFLAAWTLQNANVGRSEWFILEERLCSLRLPVIEFRNVTLEDAIARGVVPGDTTPEDVAPEDLVRDETAPETVVIRVPCIAGTRTVERSWPEWVPLASSGLSLSAGETRLFKVVHRAR